MQVLNYQTLLVAAALMAFLILWRIVKSCIISPLKQVPGPFLAKLTSKWLVLADLTGRRTLTIHHLHEKYGPSVRIGPKEISFANVEVIKDLYGQRSGFMKAPVYDSFSLPPLGIFSMRDRDDHSQRRRLLSHAFSQSNIYDSEPLLMAQVMKLVNIVEEGPHQVLNVMSLFRMFALDVVGDLFLGKSFGALDTQQPPNFLHDMDNHFLISSIDANFPWMLHILSRIPVPKIQYFLDARHRMVEYGKNAFYTYISTNGRRSTRKDLLTKVLSASSEADKGQLTDLETYVEISNLVFAGTDTTSTTLTYMFWELAKSPLWQEKLRSELQPLRSAAGREPLYFRDIAELPVLGAIINESLRLHPAAPASLPRETPQGGRTLNNFYIPENTVVSMQCYTTQRNPEVFWNPDNFDPERWLTTETTSDNAKELFMPFSKGSRACLGKNLALMELRLVTANLLSRFVVSKAPDTTDDSMAMRDHFLLLPKAGRCNLVFSPVGDEAY